MGETNELVAWNRVLDAAMRIPGARVDRDTFLSNALGPLLRPEVLRDAIEMSPAEAGVPLEVIRKAAYGSFRLHRTAVSATSALAGLPGRWWLAATIPTDLAQFFFHSVVLAQKLAYLYGWPSLVSREREVDDETKLVLTLFIGVMLGAHGATSGITRLANVLGQQAVRQLPRAALSKYAMYQLAKQVAKWVGVKLTKRRFADLAGRAVPLLGALVAGSITFGLFTAGSRRLMVHLESLPLAHRQVRVD